eukprot:COSAG01_NODE_570_length_15328_cov_82.520783_5_plen_72_part_00
MRQQLHTAHKLASQCSSSSERQRVGTGMSSSSRRARVRRAATKGAGSGLLDDDCVEAGHRTQPARAQGMAL